ncbi:MAG: arsenite efflux transporter metallochaperone ArsD [Candidatus Bruticola sp.]
MKTIKIYEPAMCCPTGLCGVSVDPELLRISTKLNTLKQNGIEVKRFNLSNAPQEFVNNKAVAEFLQKFGPEKLPVVVVDNKIVIAGHYPSNEEFAQWMGVPTKLLGVQDEKKSGNSCCCSVGCCG